MILCIITSNNSRWFILSNAGLLLRYHSLFVAHQYIPGTSSLGATDKADNILKSLSPIVSLKVD